MSSSSRFPDVARDSIYIFSRIGPKGDSLIRVKLQHATQELQREIEKEDRRIRFENRFNLNDTAVEMALRDMWVDKVRAHIHICFDIYCHHWLLRGEKRTGAFLRACSALLGAHIERLGHSAMRQASRRYIATAGLRLSRGEAYSRCAQSLRRELEEKLEIEAKELDLAESVLLSKPSSSELAKNVADRHKDVGQIYDTLQNATEKERLGKKRAKDVVQAMSEIAEIRGQMTCDDDYELLKKKYPDFMLFKVCDRNSDLKELLLGIQAHHQRKALRFAKQVAAVSNGIKLNTIEKAWDLYNPSKKTRHDDPSRSRKSQSTPLK